MANPPFIFSAAPLGSGGPSESMLSQRKRPKSGGDISSDLAALRVEDLDFSTQIRPQMSYANTLKNSTDRFTQNIPEDSVFTDDDCIFSSGKHGQNVSFSAEVHNKL